MPVWFGLIVALVATSLFNIGLALQKRGAAAQPKLGEEKGAVKALFSSRIWRLGIGVLLLGWVLYLYSTKIAPISLVQPALGMGLVVLAMFSIFYLKEQLKPLEWASLAGMIAGMVLLGLSAAGEESAGSVTWTWLLVMTALVLLITAASALLRKQERLTGVKTDALLGIISGLFIGTAAVYTRAMFLSLDEGNRVVAFAACLPVVIIANIVGIGIMQSGFQHGKAIIVVGLSAVLNKVVAIIGGMAALGEVLPESAAMSAMRIVAFALILFGSAALSRFGEDETLAAAVPEADAGALPGAE